MFSRRLRNDVETPLYYVSVLKTSNTALKRSHVCACFPLKRCGSKAAPIAPIAFSCPKFLGGYDIRGLLRYLLSQLSRAASVSGLPIRDFGFLSSYSSW
ncbi:unnamed protein product [Diabrotica balteata]|uniref:Uncharacterized protein n=1 Tax=Diabrotica balteata TaxID=107213 RepID=A0A9N9SXX8_DIABA|nr:unnamed protein product [Diabrotica balteata]